MFFLYWDVIEEYGGGFKWKIVICDKVDDLLGELPVFDSIGACDELMFRGLNFIYAEMAEGVIGIPSLVHKLLKRPVGPLGDVQVERFDLWFHI